ncbi:uncharacterized protein [Primulina huaijiensis]|uniref:uncharacterized protein n=1 Tax=Primulina huaijiensis TaxID=1492673 RepID=UPI003CC6E736
MDKDWMSKNRLSHEYEVGVEYFLQFASRNANNPNAMPCPCTNCGNLKTKDIDTIRAHLCCNGIDLTYHTWIWHGERSKFGNSMNDSDRVRQDERKYFTEEPINMVHVAYDSYAENPKQFHKLLEDAEKPLYPGCVKFTKLSALVKLYNLKAKYSWSDKSFTDLLGLFGQMLPDDNELPLSLYDAKKSLCALGMDYVKIHACPNDCILYRRILPVALFAGCQGGSWQKVTSKDLTWHADKRIRDGYLRHPADAPSWKVVDHNWPNFASEPRNLRLAISADGFNPHSLMSSAYSCWPIVMITYNLPPSLCMKRKFMMLTLLISGPKQPGNDIDLYLAPLIDDLKFLWDIGVDTYDAYRKEIFSLKAVLLWTINDFPAYGKMSGYIVKGYHACPICGEETCSTRLKHSRKIAYTGHKRFLPTSHPYRRQKKAFNGNQEFKLAPKPLNGLEVLERFERINYRLGKMSGKVQLKMKDLKLVGLKSHDYHTLMQQFLPVAIRGVLPKHILKGYVQNRHRPEWCIAERYIAEEAVEFCSDYMSSVDTIGIPSMHRRKQLTKPLSGSVMHYTSDDELNQAHRYLLENDVDVEPYIEEHMTYLDAKFPHKAKSKRWLQDEHNRTFINWIRDSVASAVGNFTREISERLKWVARGPSKQVLKYSSYLIDGVTHHTKERDDTRIVQNSGVSLVATTMQVASAKDKNPVVSDMIFYGVIQEIWELDYQMFQIPMFKCNWVENFNGIKVDDLGFTLVNLKRIGFKSDSFIFGSQAKQVFYIEDPQDPEWHVVLASPTKEYIHYMNGDELENDVSHYQCFTRGFMSMDVDGIDENEPSCIREDCDGMSKNEKPKQNTAYSANDNSCGGKTVLESTETETTISSRGRTRLDRLVRQRVHGIRKNVRFNKLGQPVGEFAGEMQSYIGVLLRKKV